MAIGFGTPRVCCQECCLSMTTEMLHLAYANNCVLKTPSATSASSRELQFSKIWWSHLDLKRHVKPCIRALVG